MDFNIEEYPKHWNIRKRAEAEFAKRTQEVKTTPRYRRMDNWIREQQLSNYENDF
jgi:hypothetical protein